MTFFQATFKILSFFFAQSKQLSHTSVSEYSPARTSVRSNLLGLPLVFAACGLSHKREELTIEAPPGPMGVFFRPGADGHAIVSELLRASSSVFGNLAVGDVVLSVDGEDTRQNTHTRSSWNTSRHRAHARAQCQTPVAAKTKG